jgi:hypothetical protein
MRKIVLLAVFTLFTLPAGASKPISVAQLEQKLTDAYTAHKEDSEVAKKVGNMQLTERLTGSTLDRLEARFSCGPLAKLALQLLADQSAFLDPPASELPATPAPDAATQARLLALARGYVVETLSRLPNLFATRTTFRFDDSPQVLKVNEWPIRAGLHMVAHTSHEITFRDGKEIVTPLNGAGSASEKSDSQPELGMQASGEFGPDLVVVMTDSASGQMNWSHWEEGSGGSLAVFRYSVPRSASHYAVHYCCMRDASAQSASSRGGRRGGRANIQTMENSHPFNDTPGYHGSIAIDPASGVILRITIEADLKVGDPLDKAASAVQYGPVVLGNRRSVCPLTSMTFSQEHIDAGTTAPASGAIRVLNETTFTHYQRLGSSVRVIPNAAENSVLAPAVQPQNR